MTIAVEERAGAVDLSVRVTPRSGRDAVKGTVGDQLAVAVSAPPEDGKANEAVLAVLANFLGVKRAAIDLIAGATSRSKRVRVTGIAAAELVARVDAGLAGIAERRSRGGRS